MIVRNANSVNWKPLDLAYMHDTDVSFKGDFEYFDEGFNFVMNNALTGVQDVSVNKFTNFYLTNPQSLTQILDITTKKEQYPKYINTYLKFYRYTFGAQAGTYFLETQNTRDIVGDTRVTTVSTKSSSYFEVELLDAIYARIRSFNGHLVTYLTYKPDTRSLFYFEPEKVGFSQSCDHQKFKYVLDSDKNTLLLTQIIDGSPYCISPVISADYPASTTVRFVDEGNVWFTPLSDFNLRLSAFPMSENISTINTKLWHLRSHKHAPEKISLQTNWHSYTTDVDTNNLNVSKSRAVTDIKNNFLLLSYTDTLSSSWPKFLPEIPVCTDDAVGKLNVDIIPLKNQHTVENKTSRTNIFDNEDTVNHRVYHGLHTGTNQEHGFDSIYLSYAAGTKEVKLISGKLTYFHFPNITDPYEILNINDTSLIDEGAIASNSPLKADKVFKKRSADNNIEKFIDEKDGTWLCTWLSGAEDPKVRPVWVDRYYQPNYFTQGNALSSINTKYLTEYDEVTLQIKSGPFFDIMSSLTFEPGVLYAYHHIGCIDNNNIVNSMSKSGDLTLSGVAVYKDLNNVLCCAAVNNSTCGAWETYEFDSDRYGVTDIPNTTGSFSISFQIDADNWQKPFAHSIAGNYDNDGIAIYNEENVTPVFVIPEGSNINIYNSNFETVRSFSLKDKFGADKQIQFLVKKESTNSIWVLADDNVIHEFDLEGIERSRISNHVLTSTRVSIIDFEVDSDNNIYLLRSPGLSGNYIKLSPALSGYDHVCENVTVKDAPITTSSSCNQYGEFQTLINQQTGAITGYQHAPHVTTIDDVTLRDVTGRIISYKGKPSVILQDTFISQGVTTDNNGDLWYILNKKLYHSKDPQTISGVAVAETYTNVPGNATSLDAVNCDKHGNIWVLYTIGDEAKLTKLRFRDETNTSSEILTTVSLGTETTVEMRYIDFLYEFTPTGYHEYVLTFNKSTTGDYVTKIDLNTGKIHNVIKLDTITKKLDLKPATVTTPRYTTSSTGSYTGTVSGYNYVHNFTPLSAYDVWPSCDNEPVETSTSREFVFNFTITNEDSYFIDYFGENKVEGYLNNTFMGTYERSIDTVSTRQYIKTLPPGNHTLRFVVHNTTGQTYEDNKLSLGFKISDAAQNILITSVNLRQSNITSLGNNPCANYFGPNVGTRAWKDLAGNAFYRNNIRKDAGRYIRVKLKAKNLYSGFLTKAQNSEFYLDWKIPPTLINGSHHITVTYDSEKGHAKLYVDSLLQDTKVIGLARYHFNELMKRPLFLGSSSFFDKEPLFQRLRQPGYYLTTGIKMSDFRVYNRALNYYEIFPLASRLSKVQDMYWNVPTGQRSFIDTIERMFKYKTPDRKSTSFNLKILNSSVDNIDMRNELEKGIKEYIKYVAPLQTNINTIKWENDELGAGETSLLTTLTSTIGVSY